MESFYGIGLMSGTSLDGLDICFAKYNFPENEFKIIHAQTYSYSDEWRDRLRNSIHLPGEELCRLDMDYGFFLGKTVNEFIKDNQIEKPDFIASHGHTVFHNPKKGYTVQIGNGAAIFAETGIRTVYDFRTADVALGGQGAPLVPIGDEMLFGKYEACLNLGGFSNISFKKENKRIAFDICPVNIVLNRLAEKSGKVYDDKGKIAKSGKVDTALLKKLNQLQYYHEKPPKSLGLEWCIENIFPLTTDSGLDEITLLSTFTEHVSGQLSKTLNENGLKNVLVTGGGVYNTFLIDLIRTKSDAEIVIPPKEIIEYKEALVFGWMGLLRIKNQINTLKSVTGAVKDHSAGIIIG